MKITVALFLAPCTFASYPTHGQSEQLQCKAAQ
jgi:hypothetical protein